MMIERSYRPSFPLRLAHKDAVLALDAAAAAGLDVPLLELVEQRMRAAIDAGHRDDDVAAAIEAGRPETRRDRRHAS
jgi:3-hydroxyisobutyrate dehydrogenase